MTALEDAGRHGDRAGERTGVFAGASPETYFLHNVLANPRATRAVGEFLTSLGNQREYLATQVSYRLDLRGPSLTVQTACSTSLVAVHLACQSLLAHEAPGWPEGSVGAADLGLSLRRGSINVARRPVPRLRGASAAGCVGNGSGIVVLRRRGRCATTTIRAVIRGSAVNNDGSVKVASRRRARGTTRVAGRSPAAAVHLPIRSPTSRRTGRDGVRGPIEIARRSRAPGRGRRGRGRLPRGPTSRG
jgi:acyl transferase domain-containing protein